MYFVKTKLVDKNLAYYAFEMHFWCAAFELELNKSVAAKKNKKEGNSSMNI